MDEMINFHRIGAVKNSDNFDDFAHKFFQVCGDGVNPNIRFSSYIIGTTDTSSFTSYFCPSEHSDGKFCFPNDSPIGWFDAHASAINEVAAQLATPSDTIFFSIEGFGQFGGYSNYSQLITIYTS